MSAGNFNFAITRLFACDLWAERVSFETNLVQMQFSVVSAAFSVLLTSREELQNINVVQSFCRKPCLCCSNETEKLCAEQNSAITMPSSKLQKWPMSVKFAGECAICRAPNHTCKKNRARLISEFLHWYVCHCVFRCCAYFCVSFPVVRKIQLHIVLHKAFGESNFRMGWFTCKGFFLTKIFAKSHKVL